MVNHSKTLFRNLFKEAILILLGQFLAYSRCKTEWANVGAGLAYDCQMQTHDRRFGAREETVCLRMKPC